jgi:hypothetical protein
MCLILGKDIVYFLRLSEFLALFFSSRLLMYSSTVIPAAAARMKIHHGKRLASFSITPALAVSSSSIVTDASEVFLFVSAGFSILSASLPVVSAAAPSDAFPLSAVASPAFEVVFPVLEAAFSEEAAAL